MASAAGSHSREDWQIFAHEVGKAWKESTHLDHDGLTPDYSARNSDNDFYYEYRLKYKHEGDLNPVSDLIHYHVFNHRTKQKPMSQLTCSGIHSDEQKFSKKKKTPEEWVEYFRHGLKTCWESKSRGRSPGRSRSPTHGRASTTHSTSVKKTPCKFYAENRCEKGDKCPFMHPGASATTHRGPSRTATTHSVSSKSTPCKFYAENKCERGDKCPFMHGTPRGGRGYRKIKSKKSQKLRYRKNKYVTIKRRVNRTYDKS